MCVCVQDSKTDQERNRLPTSKYPHKHAVYRCYRHSLILETTPSIGMSPDTQPSTPSMYHGEEEKGLEVVVQAAVYHAPIVVEEQNILHIKLTTLDGEGEREGGGGGREGGREKLNSEPEHISRSSLRQ